MIIWVMMLNSHLSKNTYFKGDIKNGIINDDRSKKL